MAFLNENDIQALKETYKISTFFETGTGNGHGLEHALSIGFDKLFSVDIVKESVAEARDKFGGKASIIYGDSFHAIDSFMTLRQPHDGAVLWFLDAHFPGVDTEKVLLENSRAKYSAEEFFPIKKELKVIQGSDCSKDVIIIDDAFLFRAGIIDTSPSGGRGILPEWRLDYLGCIEKELESLSLTHTITVKSGVTGSIVCTPK
jgi:hypothetical protein